MLPREITVKLHQIRYFVAVYQEGSFTAAARRENATQSGLSMQIKDLELTLGVKLFDRQPSGVTPTPIGVRLYEHSIRILREVNDIREDIAAMSGAVTGEVHVGLMPTFTRAILAPALMAFKAQYPHVDVRVTEAYSGVLAQEVARNALDFAIVPPGHAIAGVRSRYLGTDHEYLVTSPNTNRTHFAPVELAREGALRLIAPGPTNARRGRIDRYLESCGVEIAEILEMDAMMGTLDLVARSDWVTILSGVLCAPDRDGVARKLHPLVGPPLKVDYVLIEPAARSLSAAAKLFADTLAQEMNALLAEEAV
jgi:LysR family transcriptional regulator, nitrogen assimilation regulatory protein